MTRRSVKLSSALVAGCMIASAAQAATAPAPTGFGSQAATAHEHDAVPDLRALPGDRLPPFGMLDQNSVLVPAPNGGGPPPNYDPTAQHSRVPAPSMEVALAGAQAAIQACKARNRRGAVAVVDSAGEARVMLTADGDDGSHVFVAQRKTLAALAFKAPSADARAMIDKDPSLLAKVTPAMFVQFGAIPITSGGQIIGAIGYSGGDDVACATAGWRVIQDRLPK